MSYKVIEKNEYGIRVRNYSEIPDCKLCKNHAAKNTCNRSECAPNSYYLSDSEVERLESEQIIVQDFFKVNSKKDQELLKEMQTMINNQDNSLADAYTKKVESEMQVFYDTQKELIDLQNENKQLKERIKELENNTTELSENQIAELAQIGSKYLYLGALEEGMISYGGIIEILNRYNEMCK